MNENIQLEISIFIESKIAGLSLDDRKSLLRELIEELKEQLELSALDERWENDDEDEDFDEDEEFYSDFD